MAIGRAAGSTIMKSAATSLLQEMLGPKAAFREGQWEAIERLVARKQRLLVVQRTGWGKSIVYFLATRLLRDRGAGPTLLISPLLSLMRNQIDMAARIGVRAITINSTNRSDWDAAEQALESEECDVLLISPERLGNPAFRSSLLPAALSRAGLLVVDEAHCISDWGHDFRPDYRRIVELVRRLPRGVPVLGTTATANNRVVADVQSQLGRDVVVMRGPLARSSLRLQCISLADQSERMAWLVENLPKFKGSGIIYCLTVADAQKVAGWLKLKGFAAEAYHAGDDANIDREALEQALLNNEVKALVATVALGMGFDKPDLVFVIHFQRPGSVVSYYQQVGRAGRATDRAYGILLSGREDDEIQDYFIESAFPSPVTMTAIAVALESAGELSIGEILTRVNVTRSTAERALKLMEVDGAIKAELRDKHMIYRRSAALWEPDVERVERVNALRRAELDQMRKYVAHQGCLMEFLARALDDRAAQPCGSCANCKGRGLSGDVSGALVAEAVEFLKITEIAIEPRKQWPAGFLPGVKQTIPAELRNLPGRALCFYGDAGWGRMVREGKYVRGRFDDELVTAAARLILERWLPDPFPKWAAAIPSPRHPRLVYDFAERLAAQLAIPFVTALERKGGAPEQKTMASSSMQAGNVLGTLGIIESAVRPGPVLLIDDIVDSGWTLTIAGHLLAKYGAGPVHPFALASATPRVS